MLRHLRLAHKKHWDLVPRFSSGFETTLLTEHARRLHVSAAALSSKPAAQGDPSPLPADSAAAVKPPTGGDAAPSAAAAAAVSAGVQQQQNPKSWAAVPSVAKTLGLAGLIPFIALAPPIAAQIPLLPPDVLNNAALLQVGYGATIASFLGGVHWGAAMLDMRPAAARLALERYLWSVTPCLMAWPAVMLPSGPGAFVVATTLGIVHAVDRSFWRRGLLPPWYMSLRLPLTTLAISGLLITAASNFMSERADLVQKAEQQQH